VANLSWKVAILRVLAEAGEPLHYGEITTRIFQQGLKSTSGATPKATVNQTITSSIANEGSESPFKRTARGMYALREVEVGAPASGTDEVSDDGTNPIEAFGYYWGRDWVRWQTSPRLYGRQDPRANRVDLADQQGVYLLHDARGTIYVGQTASLGLGRRIARHHFGRLASRWKWFSWFGLRPVDNRGNLGDPAATTTTAQLIDLMEALLIETIEPRQNRQAGQGMGDEYLQADDPKYDRRR